MKWYVVWVGNNPGIYETWEDCKLQVENFPGARYKAFKTREDAIMALRGDNESEMGILRSIANANRHMVNYEAFPDIIVDSIAVDAACSGNRGVTEYRGVGTNRRADLPQGTVPSCHKQYRRISCHCARFGTIEAAR